MKLGYTIIYVPNVLETISFYENAFGLRLRMLHDSNLYAEMETGDTVLAFAGNEMAGFNGFKIRENSPLTDPSGFEIAFVTDNVQMSFDTAIANGAVSASEPEEKPWGQTVSYVRDINGVLVEICSPIG